MRVVLDPVRPLPLIGDGGEGGARVVPAVSKAERGQGAARHGGAIQVLGGFGRKAGCGCVARWFVRVVLDPACPLPPAPAQRR